MSRILIWLFIILAFSCKDDEKFDPNNYDGQYPRNLDGSEMKTYNTQVIGGKIEGYFNGHSWNHAPFLSINVTRFDPPKTTANEPEVIINIATMLTGSQIEPCLMESFLVRAPLKVSTTSINDFTKLHDPEYAHVKFTSINCDAGKDQYALDRSKPSIVKITQYDIENKEIHAEYDVYFSMIVRNSNFGPVYPEKVHLQGKLVAKVK
ncbi:hypothetical protein [Dyadobacter sp. 676]|uniref:DUF4843 domain-containing protein n=1 Tax=Dyadobacter sp. 676 TaxID=3088362 RepID=A0AAU8FNI7_9BACT